MTKEKTYFRPDDLKTALALLQRPDIHAVPLAGGSWLVPHLRTDVDLPGSLAAEVDAVVDLAGLGLNTLRLEGSPGSGWLHLGATTLLADLVDGEACQAIAGGLVAEAARREGPINLRNAATVAGSVLAGDSASELLLALLALDAQAIVIDDNDSERAMPLAELLADRPGMLGRGLITELRVLWPSDGVRGGLSRVARTPADHPIVAAAAVVDDNSARVAIGGLTPLPILVHFNAGDDLAQTVASALSGLNLVSDFRGSAEYRQAMAPILVHRAVEQAHS